MLRTITIESLFDIYTYSLDLRPDMEPFHFVTGPNGYGKTTVLKILKALYSSDMKMLADIPFGKIHLLFDDGYEMAVTQKRKFDEEEESDEQIQQSVTLHIEFGICGEENSKEIIDWDDTKETTSGISNISLYFQSHPVYHISDGRMFTPEGQPAVTECANKMKDIMRNADEPNQKARLEAFKNIVECSGFVHKSMEIAPTYGMRFIADNEDRTILTVDKLSSGEQQILIQTFELLFSAPDDSLVLIDKPEISYHIMWQVDYMKNLRTITNLRNLQCIICTHSPQIFNMDWNLTVDLYEQSNVSINIDE